ncbi:dsDNA nuclease domain-containing protein [Rhodoferax mekongensis]|uniref:DsDNA nuclease domain-containing protein n=1 Tax=Rhodoferax mekongensis TaxID=3068341 RepID=A0ABZ0AWE4_9BURK|nr:dsDNA nuclease domain-containing protein [Rhodoferax sp. TBRC 17307]WNO03967.1 dsDNA nuclease domain-containing protein [Rhodoferax sp. TBRC 17307]
MTIPVTSRIAEIEKIESDDNLHDFAGPHSGKGSDFASYWIIFRIVELEKAKRSDYLFVCEYMQDVAEFDSSSAPEHLKLYQLKKKEGGYWTESELTGQTKKKKMPKGDKPVMKLMNHVLSFQALQATGVFLSNSKFHVALATGQSSINQESIGLHELEATYCAELKKAIADTRSINPSDVDLKVLELRYTPLALDDLERHLSGVMLEYLTEIAPDSASQASSLVETLFSRIRARARRTEKCVGLSDLISKRGFPRDSFVKAVESLKAIPNGAAHRIKLLDKLSQKYDWSTYEQTQVQIALTVCAREKILAGDACRWALDKSSLASILSISVDMGYSDQETFESVCECLAAEIPELRPMEIKALAIYEMTEWNLNQTRA